MGKPGASRRMRVQPAWRATSSEEEARAFLQQRLSTFSGVLFTSLAALNLAFCVLYTAFSEIAPAHWPIVRAGCGVGLLGLAGIWRLVLERRPVSERALYGIDACYAVMVGLAFGAAALFSPERRAAGYAVLIETIFVMFTRAFVVPSTGRRTAVIASLTYAPIVLAALGLALTTEQDVPREVYVTGAVLLGAVAVLLATLGSRLIYVLQRQVSEATQLGQYRIEAQIGEGGMGTVYRAHHVMLRRPTAIKLLRADRIGAEPMARFEREVQHTSQLAHPNTVAVFDYGHSSDGRFYYAMEYLDGLDLEQIVTHHGPLGDSRTIHVLAQVCGALQEAHERGIVHRDIKPANIMLCEHGGVSDVAKVVDFGLAKELTTDALQSQENILGTPAYLAPEVITDARAVSPAADLYALGAVGYFLLAGRRVFEGKNGVAVVLQHVTTAPTPLGSIATVAPSLEAVIMRCLCKRPEERFASAAELARALRAIAVAEWTEDAAAAWWTAHRTAPHVTPSAAPTQSITIDMEHRR